MSTLKKLAGETALYGISTIAGRMLNYLLVPFFTTVFGAAQYGVLTDVYAIAAFLNVIATFGLETAYFRFATRDKEKADWFYQQAWSGVFFISLITAVGLAAFATPIVNYLNYPGQEEYLWLLAGIIFIDAVVVIPFAQLRLQNRPVKFVTVRLSSIFANVALNLALLYLWPKVTGQVLQADFALQMVFAINLISNALMLPLLWRQLAALRPRFDWAALKPMVNYGYPILLMGLAGMINEMLGRLVLKKVLPEGFYPGISNQEALGIFGACYKLAVFMTITIQAFRYAAEPFFFNRAGDKQSPQVFARVMLGFTWFCGLIMAGVCLNLNWIGPLFLRREIYWQGLNIVPLLLLANLFLGIYYNLTVWFKLTDRTQFGTYISVAGALLTLVGNFLLIPVLGYTGSALSTLICYGLMAVACYLLGQKYYPVPYPVGQIAGILVLATALAYFGIYWKGGNFWLDLLVKNGLALVMAALAWLSIRRHLRTA